MAHSKPSISIIIPVYNEEKRIVRCLTRIPEYCTSKQWDYEVIIAEDGSTDNTVKIVQEFSSANSKIKILSYKERLGKGGAIKNAMLKSTKDYVCFLDADLSADISELDRLIKYIDEYDIVIGSRLLRGDLEPIKRKLHRSFFSYFYSKAFRILFRLPIHDSQCGMKLFRKEVVSKLFNEIHTTGFAFDSEIIVKAYWLYLKIKEVPIIWNYDDATKINVLKQIKVMGRDLLLIWYESHLMWLQNLPTYPQKRGSRKARLFFLFLSLFLKTKTNP